MHTARTPKVQPERAQTDEGLRTERKNTDDVIAERMAASESAADAVVERARERSDEVLTEARDKADEKLEGKVPSLKERGALEQTRAVEDVAVQEARDAADAAMDVERALVAPTLVALLPLERLKTDRYLLTERARSDAALASRDDFLGMVAHDLRSLLGGVVLSTSAVVRKASDSDDGRRTVGEMNKIERYAARMNRLIGDLVDVAAIDAGKLAIEKAPGDAALLLSEVEETFAPIAAEKGLALSVEVAEPALRGDFDHDRILQVLVNLVSNACKFTPPGGAVVLRAARDEGGLRLSVADTGEGIADDMREAVFERFWQVGKNDRRGLGLGLYISKSIVLAHGGTIRVHSTPGEGSVFSFTLP